MPKLYLSNDKQQTLMLRRLMAIDAFCGTMEMGYRMPKVDVEEMKSVKIVIEYANRHIKEQLKSCEFFSKMSQKELDEQAACDKISMITKATIGTCCVLSEEAEMVLAELQRLGKCKTIQEALKTGKNVIMII